MDEDDDLYDLGATPLAPRWSARGAVAVCRLASSDLEDIGAIRKALGGLWRDLGTRQEVRAVGLLVDGRHPSMLPPRMATDRDGDPLIGPRSCGVARPVVVGLHGTVDAAYFPLISEADIVIGTRHAWLRDRSSVGDRDPTWSTGLALPPNELARLALLGTLSITRAHELGVVQHLCESHELTRRTVELAARWGGQVT